MNNKFVLVSLIVLTVLTILAGSYLSITTKDDNKTEKEITEIIYKFTDNSAIEFNNSYEITVKPSKAYIFVYNGERVLVQKDNDITKAQYDLVLASLNTNISKTEASDINSCTGGTNELVEYSSNEEILFSAGAYTCDGITIGELKGDVDQFAKDVRNLFPDFETLINTSGQ